MKDFIFGSLSTGELRQEHERQILGGITHRFQRAPRDPGPGEAVELILAAGPTCPADRAWIYYTTDGSDPQGEFGRPTNGYAICMEPVQTEWNTIDWGYIRRFQGQIPPQPEGTVVRYRLSAGIPDQWEGFADQGKYYAYYVADDPTPAWTREAVIYHIFVDRFSPGAGKAWNRPDRLDGFFGGTLRGITDHLDYLGELGVNTLYLSPVFPSSSHHGYNATDFFSIEPRFGTLDDFRRLLDAAHARSMRILLDFVPNHWSDEHPTFRSAISDPASPYRDWYNFNHWPDDYEGFFGVKCLPQINLRTPAARQHVLDAARHWLELGVDGYRIDYAIGPTPDFWADFRKTVRLAKPEVWTFGEVVDPPTSQLTFEGLFDGCLDFMLLEAFRQTFAYDAWTALQFASFLDRHQAYFPAGFSRPCFLDNHDMDRFLWAAGGNKDRLKIAALCQFTLSGPPMIYYGTEVGLSQERGVRQAGSTFGYLEEARLPMIWGSEQDADLYDFYRSLIQTRARFSCLMNGQWSLAQTSPDTLIYFRSDPTERLAIAINLAGQERRVSLNGPWKSILFETKPGSSIVTGADAMDLNLSPQSGVIIR